MNIKKYGLGFYQLDPLPTKTELADYFEIY